MSSAPLKLIGRSSSHFTRVARIVAHELGVPLVLRPVYELGALEAAAFGGNPARKLPSMRREHGELLFGTENICRALAEAAGPTAGQVIWPEALRSDLSRNAQELVWHGMAVQVQLITGTIFAKLPADNPFFVKARTGFEGALGWLDQHIDAALAALPSPRLVSLLEVTLFCLIEHMTFRETVSLAPYGRLREVARGFAERPSARATPYHVDQR